MLFAHSTARLRKSTGAVPPTGLVLIAVASVQLGSAFAKQVFTDLGPGGMVLLRVGFGALVLAAVWRPRMRGYTRSEYGVAMLFGFVLAAMNLSFYLALDRVPLGIAVTLEFVGPLGVAVAGSRRLLDAVWVLLAGSGVVLLAPKGGSHIDPWGVFFALLAGTCWAAYIYLSARVGKTFQGVSGLTIALVFGTIILVPVGLITSGTALLNPGPLLVGLAVALLSSVIPYSLELEALRRLPKRVFGVLMSIEPAAAALFGFIVLREVLGARALIAIFMVTVAAIGSSRFGQPTPVP